MAASRSKPIEQLKAMCIPHLEAIAAQLPADAKLCFMVWVGDNAPVVLSGNCTMEDSMDAMLLAAQKGNRFDTDKASKYRRLIS